MRPHDWHVLDLTDDPTPGSPPGVRALSGRLRSVGDDAADAERGVRSLAGDQAVLSWVGLAGDVFRGAIDDFPGQLHKLADSYHQASSALGSWASDLEGAQAQADRALVKGRAARERLDSLQGQLSGAQGSLSSSSTSYDRLHNPPAGGSAPDPDQVRSALRNQQAAASRVSGLSSQVGDAQAELDLAKRLARDAADLRDGAAEAAKSRIHDAADAGIKPNSFWEDFSSAVAKVWKVVVVIAKITVAVLGVVVLIIGGPLAWVVFAAALLLLADALLKYANGEGSMWDVGFALLGCIPGTKGLTTLGELSTAFRAGGMLGAGAHVLGAGRTALADMAMSVRALGDGLTLTVRRLAVDDAGSVTLGGFLRDAAEAGDTAAAAEVVDAAAHRPEWLKRVQEGSEWHRAQQQEIRDLGGQTELYLHRPGTEAATAAGEKASYVRVDAYRQQPPEIISMKHTQLSAVQEQTAMGELTELAKKYPRNAVIADVPSTAPHMVGEVLRGDQILLVPVQHEPIPARVLAKARELEIIIRDTEGTVYK